ncbi:MAG: Gfo/Idh/MocA family oxidoreductase [Paracoccaceae bacterium]|nr:Gfo/Idh/MocA family oxidoreductase [Paracoccaceae bacterium]
MTRPFGFALVGTGMAALPHGRALAELHPDPGMIAVHSRRAAGREAFAAQFGFRPVERFESILNDPSIDAVILATPPDQRRPLVDGLAAAGKHILSEKPLERSTAAAGGIAGICRNQGVRLGVVFQHRYRPAVRALAERLAFGHLGAIRLVRAEVPWWRPQSYYDEPGRGSLERDGGGVLISQAIHTLDLLLHLVGPVTEVQALAATSAFHRMETEDFAVAGLRFACGAPGSVLATTAAWPGTGESIRLDCDLASAILGDGQLRLLWRDGREETIGQRSGTGSGADPMAFPYDWHRDLIAAFRNRVRKGENPEVSGEDGLAVQGLIEAMIQSSAEGKRIRLSHSGDRLLPSC